MKEIEIFSENNDFQYIETLSRNRQKRHKNREFFVEGVVPINRLLENSFSVRAFAIPKDKKLSKWASDIVKDGHSNTVYLLPSKLFNKLSLKEESSELLALVQMPEDNLSRIKTSKELLVIVFDRPVQHGNLGALIRSCDSFSADGLVVTGHSVDIYDPKVISASRGSLFDVPVVWQESSSNIADWVKKIKKQYPNVQIVGTDETATININEHDFKKPTILLLGNETRGLSKAYKEISDRLVCIPMSGKATSLNVSCAGSILLYEIYNQRK